MLKLVPEVGCCYNKKLKCMALIALLVDTVGTSYRPENWQLCCGKTFKETVTSDNLEGNQCIHPVRTSREVVRKTAKIS